MAPGAFEDPYKAHINVEAQITEDSTKAPRNLSKPLQYEKPTETNIIC